MRERERVGEGGRERELEKLIEENNKKDMKTKIKIKIIFILVFFRL